MPEIRNSVELKMIMEKIVTEAIEEVSKKVLKRLRENITKYTYESHDRNKWYYAGTQTPTRQFLYAFEWKALQKEAQGITKELFYNWEKMNALSDEWIHGSNVPGWPTDAREFLADWLNRSGPSSRLWISVNHEPYWTITLQELFSSNELKKWFDEAMRKRGALPR